MKGKGLSFTLGLLVVAGGCESTLVGSHDGQVRVDAARAEASTVDTSVRGEHRRADGAAAKPCQPLPPGCACAEACQAGVCDNSRCPCAAVPGVSYGTLAPGSPHGGDASKQGDMNLLLRKWRTAAEAKQLVDVAGPTDYTPPPQLYSLFVDDRVPGFGQVYQVQSWDWGCNCAGAYLDEPRVTLAGMTTAAGEVIRAPFSGYDIGAGHTALVIYAARGTLTLKYTADDDVVKGYTVHLDGICVEPSLQALYDKGVAGGRKQLPAVKGRQPIGRAIGTEVRAAIRDCGSWMDPRSRKDWWQGR